MLRPHGVLAQSTRAGQHVPSMEINREITHISFQTALYDICIALSLLSKYGQQQIQPHSTPKLIT